MTEDQFEDYLTELYGKVDICGVEYNSGYALRELDPIAFDVAYSDYEAN